VAWDRPEPRAWGRQFLPEFPVLHLGLMKGSDERFVVDLELPEFFGLCVPQFAEPGEPPPEPQFAFGDGLPVPDFVVEGVLEVDVPPISVFRKRRGTTTITWPAERPAE
jgi:hypothetical protein